MLWPVDTHAWRNLLRPKPLSRRSTLFDAGCALLLTVIVLWGSVGEADALVNGKPITPHPGVIDYAMVTVAAAVTAVRRRLPWPVYAVTMLFVLVYTARGFVDGSALLAPMTALYTVIVTLSLRNALIVGGATLLALFAVDSAFEPFGAFGGSVTVLPFETAGVIFLGIAVANRRAYVAAITDRALQAERTREDEARRRVDAERLRIARELHDIVAHTISVINVQVRVATQVIPDPPQAGADALAAIKEASVEALRELRGILDLLRQPGDERDALPAAGLGQLDALAAATRRAGLPVRLATSGSVRRLPPPVDLAAYRIVQESLTNTLRHAGSATATVTVRYGDESVEIEVEDDGRGAAAPASPTQPFPTAGSGYGITGMQERAAAVGGRVEAGAKPGGGFLVRARLPIPAGAGSAARSQVADAVHTTGVHSESGGHSERGVHSESGAHSD
jgi:signal transduction histidine kinase